MSPLSGSSTADQGQLPCPRSRSGQALGMTQWACHPEAALRRGICLSPPSGSSTADQDQLPRLPSLPLGAGARDDTVGLSSRGSTSAEGSACRLRPEAARRTKTSPLACPRSRPGQALGMTHSACHPEAALSPRDLLAGFTTERSVAGTASTARAARAVIRLLRLEPVRVVRGRRSRR